ncbi:MAG: acyltransferase [Actinobacteria bacterium]|nr:acyltransferase [Actinomycetota bacterium]
MTASAPTRGFRPDVEGLRAIAVLTVMWFHARLPGLPGGFAGVDIFFVISGFLITGQLVREVERDGRVSLPRFYARRAKRLFPAAATVLVTTGLLTATVLSRIDRHDFGGDIVAAAAYVVNWRLADRSVDYLAEDVGASPVQHFWSLAVEEQFYIVWPLLIVLLTFLIRRGHVATRPGLALGLAAITIPSLAWSIHLTSANPRTAYFVTTTRLWELGIGALVAVGAGVWLRLPRAYGALLAWGGLALIAAGLLLQSTGTAWPGSAALVPTLGAAAVIAGGFRARVGAPVRLLGMRWPVLIGALSYSLYLWHWPLVVVADHLSGDATGWAAAAVVFSALPAWLTHRFIENPVRYHPRVSGSRVALALGLACSLLGVAAGAATTVSSRLGRGSTVTADSAPGAAALETLTSARPTGATGSVPTVQPLDPDTLNDPALGITPDPLEAVDDVPQAHRDQCQATADSSDVKRCEYGPSGAKTQVAVLGDSKMLQWMPALEAIAIRNDWRLILYIKSTCTFADVMVDIDGRPYTACRAWGEEVFGRLAGNERPDVVITSSLRSDALVDGRLDTAALSEGYARWWRALGVPVIAIADNPQPGGEIYACVADHPTSYMSDCSRPAGPGSGTRALAAAVEMVDTSRLVNLNDVICPGGTCWPVIGNVLVYRSGSHITATFVNTLIDTLATRLDIALTDLGVRH